MTAATAVVEFDGGSRGNPGLAAGGAVLIAPDGTHHQVSRVLPHATNNVAEYTGAILGLEKALEQGVGRVVLRGDSQLVVKQLAREWKCNHRHLQELRDQALELLGKFESYSLEWVPRAQNRAADDLCNRAMDTYARS